MPYNIGDRVWYAGRESTTKEVVCPECFGKKYLTVILGDDSQVTIDCAGCKLGYNPPRGYITYWEQKPSIRQVTICKVEITSDHVEYGYDGTGSSCLIAKETELFDTEEKAEIRAEELAEEWNKEKLAEIHRKEKNNHTWSWHVHYHRSQIREAERTIEYAREKLDAAKTHVKNGQ